MRLAIITTHPIQYYAPVFKLLHQRGRIHINVYYTWGEASLKKHDPGFGKTIAWDVPLLEGYPYEWVQNTSPNPGSHYFKGIINPKLIKQVEGYKPDAILVFGWAYHSHLKVLRYFHNKIPVCFRGDSTLLDDQGGVKSFLRAVFLKWVYRHVNHAFYTGTNNKAYFKKYGLREAQLSLAPHAVDNEYFAAPRTSEAARIRTENGISTNAVVILFAGKLESKKDPQLLLAAFMQMAMTDTHLVFAGDGKLKAELQSMASGSKNVHFLGFRNQSEMPAVYQLCDIFCLPSKGPGETWGLAVNEAMACSRAVVVSDKVGCAIDLVRPENGEIFRSGLITDLAAKLTKLVAGKQKLQTMGNNAAGLIKHLNFDTIAAVIENTVLQHNRQ